MPSFLQV